MSAALRPQGTRDKVAPARVFRALAIYGAHDVEEGSSDLDVVAHALLKGDLRNVSGAVGASPNELHDYLASGQWASGGWEGYPLVNDRKVSMPAELVLTAYLQQARTSPTHTQAISRTSAALRVRSKKLRDYLEGGGWKPGGDRDWSSAPAAAARGPLAVDLRIGRKALHPDELLGLYAVATRQSLDQVVDELKTHTPRPEVIAAIAAYKEIEPGRLAEYVERGEWGGLSPERLSRASLHGSVSSKIPWTKTISAGELANLIRNRWVGDAFEGRGGYQVTPTDVRTIARTFGVPVSAVQAQVVGGRIPSGLTVVWVGQTTRHITENELDDVVGDNWHGGDRDGGTGASSGRYKVSRADVETIAGAFDVPVEAIQAKVRRGYIPFELRVKIDPRVHVQPIDHAPDAVLAAYAEFARPDEMRELFAVLSGDSKRLRLKSTTVRKVAVRLGVRTEQLEDYLFENRWLGGPAAPKRAPVPLANVFASAQPSGELRPSVPELDQEAAMRLFLRAGADGYLDHDRRLVESLRLDKAYATAAFVEALASAHQEALGASPRLRRAYGADQPAEPPVTE